MKLPNARMLILLVALGVAFLIGAGMAYGQTPANGMLAERTLAFQELSASLQGVAEESPRIFKTSEGYLRFIGAPPSTHFAVEPAKRRTPQEAADAFLEQRRNLFVNVSPPVGFDTIRVKTRDSRTYVRYQQTYAGLDVFGAEMIVQVNAAGGIVAVMSDVMRDTQALDTGEVELTPTIDALTAQGKAIEWLAAQHEQLKFEASDATLMIFDPPVVGWKGPTQLVWHIKVSNVGELRVEEFMLVDAHSGRVAFNYSLICYALNRRIYDCNTSTWYYEQSDWPTGIEDVDLAYDYLEDTYNFFLDHHQHDGYNNAGADSVAHVRYGSCTAWTGSYMMIEPGWVVDDLVAHEFAHGVNYTNCYLAYTHNEAGAINEMFCDIWGELVDQENKVSKTGNDQAGDKWLVFEDLDSGAWRDMADPPSSDHGPAPDRLYGEHWYISGECPDARGCWEPTKYCFTHRNNGVGNKLCYLLTDGDTFNGHTISGMGPNTVTDLFYESQSILTGNCEYYDLYYALTQAAIDLSLSQAERDNIEQGCRAVEIAPNLMAWWKLDETSGSTATDSIGSNNGTLTNMEPETDWVTGKINGALDFDGTNEYVSLSPIEALKHRSVTIAAWIRADDVNNYNHPIVTQYPNNGYYFYVNDDKPALWLNSDSAESSDSISTDTWYHLAGTYDGSDLKIYVDGVLKDTTSLSGGGTSHNAYIGYGEDGSGSYFDGIIDDVRIYNYALDANEIWDVMVSDTSKLYIKDSSDVAVAWLGNLGNVVLEGTLTQGEAPTATGDDELRFQDPNGTDIAIIDANDGNMYIAGSLYEDQETLTDDNFVIKDSDGDVVVHIDESGNVYLKGRLYEESSP